MFARPLLSALLVSVVATASAVQSQKMIIVSVVDQKGAPVKAVAATDLLVQEDGVTRDVVDVKPAAEPMTIALIVDNTKPSTGKDAPTRELRAALTTFVTTVQAASPQSAIGLWEFAGAGVMTQKPTVKTDDLTKKISHMFPSQQPGGVLLEALVDASRELNKKTIGPRRIIVSVSLDSQETSTLDPRDVAVAMRKAGVNFWAVSIGSSTPSREIILNNVTDASGGMRMSGVTPISLEAQLKNVAEAVTSQYIVTYARPGGAGDPKDIRAVAKNGSKALTAPWVQ